jgi:GDPmannose 4,6-dehydratase
MLQQDEPDDYVIGTGESHSVEEFADIAFSHAGLDWRRHVVIDPRFYRPAEVDVVTADPSLAREKLGWTPETSFEDLVRTMVDSDIAALSKEQTPAPAGGEADDGPDAPVADAA